jgi:hypothetical protein
MRTIIATALLTCIAFSSTVLAQPESIPVQGPFGLGIMVGEPSGVSGKFYLNRTNAIQGALAWSFSNDNELLLQGDYIYQRYDIITVKKGLLPVYFGIGGRIVFREARSNLIGVRVPVGLDYIFEGAPLDIFAEIVPILDLAPDTEFDFGAALGIRYFF